MDLKTILFVLTILLPTTITHIRVEHKVVEPTPYETKRAFHLSLIKRIESNNGQNTNHIPMNTGMHKGMAAYGSYGLMPITIQETVKQNPVLSSRYTIILQTNPKFIHLVMKKYPSLEEQVAIAHYDRLAKIFGQRLDRIGYAWFQGTAATKRAIKSNVDIANHWHVQKLLIAKQLASR